MRNQFFKIAAALVMALSLVVGGAVQAATKKVPVSMIMQAKGDVTYSKDGAKWKKVRKNKFLFAGYTIKTGSDGSGVVINQAENTSRNLGPNSVITINDEGAQLVSGALSDPVAASGNMIASLTKRFSKAQRYTTVRRGVMHVEQKTIKKLTLSAAYPELVWQNFGSDYTFRLVIDGKAHDVASSTGDLVSYKVSGLPPGKHSYRIEILKGGSVVFKPKRDGNIVWLSNEEEAAYLAGEKAIREMSAGDDFLVAAHMDEKGFLVPAMKTYQKYFQENPDDNDMRPMLIKAYFDLKLNKQRIEEAGKYNEIADSEG